MPRFPLFAALYAAVFVAACGSDKPEVSAEDPAPDQCAANWRIIHSPEQDPISFLPKVLAWHDGRIFTAVNSFPTSRLFSLSDAGSPPEPLYEEEIYGLWFEGDRLLFAGNGPRTMIDGVSTAPLLLYAMPAVGGPAEVVLTTHIRDTARIDRTRGFALDTAALYWLRAEYGPDARAFWALWRGRRDGGGDEELASLISADNWPDDFLLTESLLEGVVVPLADQVIVYNGSIETGRTIFRVPKDGGDATRLPSWPGGKVLGVAGDGTVLWQRFVGGDLGQKRGERYEVGRALPGAAAVTPFWSDKPAHAYPHQAWDDGAGGFYVYLWEWGTDDAIHGTIWLVDAAGSARRLACDPQVGTIVRTAAVAPDGIYVIVQYSSRYWEIVKIAKAPSGGQ